MKRDRDSIEENEVISKGDSNKCRRVIDSMPAMKFEVHISKDPKGVTTRSLEIRRDDSLGDSDIKQKILERMKHKDEKKKIMKEKLLAILATGAPVYDKSLSFLALECKSHLCDNMDNIDFPAHISDVIENCDDKLIKYQLKDMEVTSELDIQNAAIKSTFTNIKFGDKVDHLNIKFVISDIIFDMKNENENDNKNEDVPTYSDNAEENDGNNNNMKDICKICHVNGDHACEDINSWETITPKEDEKQSS